MINLTKTSIMKLTKTLLIVALFGAGLFASCTPESIEDGQNQQQVDKTLKPLQNG
jgi:hypothetical protein